MSNAWSAQIVALWRERCGGPPQVWHLKALKPVVDQYGVDVVKRVLDYYLNQTEVRYVSLPSFVSKFGAWHKVAIPQVKLNPGRFTPH
jgi:glycerophosphoryl diester phosphodiesterase